MARIPDEDIARVREASPIDAVVGDYVQLRSAGGGELKGLCPFHDEKSPSFHLTPARGLYHCFGCGVGGDTIDFVMRIEHLSFAEAVERLAQRAGIEIRYEQGGASTRGGNAGQRTRLVAAHRAAVDFYVSRLAEDPAAKPARAFLAERGFDDAAAAAYSVGYSPDSWDALTRHLAALGFSREELLAAGLVSQGQRGVVDRFRGRLMFPIRDNTGDPIGFGARALKEGDQPKYLNTPETPIYKKSHVLYGLDKARLEIGRRAQAVVVEGYTDVMACHLAGVPTAVATCGTSLTADHIQMLRRLLMDQDEFRGEVVFTFDGDNAGQRAALKVFEEDARFVTQTFVAVEATGLDPCELRLAKGDGAVRDLVARRVPLFEFKLRAELDRYDLDTAEGRVRALATCAPIVASIRDRALRPEYARRLAGWLGLPVEEVTPAIAEAAGRAESARATASGAAGNAAAAAADAAGAPQAPARPASDDPALRVERESLKSVIQSPGLVGPVWDTLDPELFTHPAYRACHAAVAAAGGVRSFGAASGGVSGFVSRVRDAAADDTVRSLVTELAVEPLRTDDPQRPAYVRQQVARLQEMGLTRRITETKSRLQRLNPVEQPERYNALFSELVDMQARQRALREQAIDPGPGS
ncbi:MAG TPA: DNA primase [Mycobacteriales bacterium]|nr:DNA primase [Mycobacteriales bacterium]